MSWAWLRASSQKTLIAYKPTVRVYIYIYMYVCIYVLIDMF